MATQERWKPERPVSKGASGYHEAVAKAPYYQENLKAMIPLLRDIVKEGHIIVDFGAGTGVSAQCLLEGIDKGVELWLVDNSPAWLGKAYELLAHDKRVSFFLLNREGERYQTLAEVVGEASADHVISANTLHLIPSLKEVFAGIRRALKPGGSFLFQSGNIERPDRKAGVLMVDHTVKRVHDIAIGIIQKDNAFRQYRRNLDEHIAKEEVQRKFVFPEPRDIADYLTALKEAGFTDIRTEYQLIRISYADWLNFLRVHRLQAGILPEVGGKDATIGEEKDRDRLITLAAKRLFAELEKENPEADSEGFMTEWVYVLAKNQAAAEEKKGEVGSMKGKNAVITGSTRGIGSAIARELAKAGCNIIINGTERSKERGEEMVTELSALGVQARFIPADVSNFASCGEFAREVKEAFGKVDILVNNAGTTKDVTLRKMSEEDWHSIINVNLNSLFNVTRNFLSLIPDKGRIINISSIVGISGNFGQTNYASTKAGVIGFSKSLAKEMGKRRITVNAIAPGFIKTELTDQMPMEFVAKILQLIPMKEMGKPEDVAHAVAFLASEKARYITGQVLRVDGGIMF
ncbi:TPA: 3-oxoacyl-[acyl-carrier-protein] reductase [Candidatus Woesearchaeota archaeon]|nr:3-oxoacyl-[acyl-carrier-protein] reductase [Candidatus Woesearchaeota archaeon]HII69446.1 3-oxoacyl-[acyl-carrier-protein] reductase [Candidatus Woesearchaeota archaeon]